MKNVGAVLKMWSFFCGVAVPDAEVDHLTINLCCCEIKRRCAVELQ